MSAFFLKKLDKYVSKYEKSIPEETRKILGKNYKQLTEGERLGYQQAIEPYQQFIIDALEAMYLQEGRPEKWAKLLKKAGDHTIIENLAFLMVAANNAGAVNGDLGSGLPAEGAAVLDVDAKTEEAPMPITGENETSEILKIPPTVVISPPEEMGEVDVKAEKIRSALEAASQEEGESADIGNAEVGTETVILNTTDEVGANPTLVVQRPMVVDSRPEIEKQAIPAIPISAILISQGLEETSLENYSSGALEGKKPSLTSWFSRHKKAVLIALVAVVVLGASTFLALFLIKGRERVIYQWSRSQRIGYDMRVERELIMEKNVGESPYLYTVDFRVTNQGDEALKVMNIEEEFPGILVKKGKLSFEDKPERKAEDLTGAGWSGQAIQPDEVFEVSYSLPLEAELSKPQLDEIEEHFNNQIIAYIGLPETQIKCSSCDGIGNSVCGGCSGVGSTTCSNCGGAGNFTCSACSGNGTYTCSTCGGYGYYYRCYRCNAVFHKDWTSCHSCGSTYVYRNTYTCYGCNGTGIAKCSTCGGSGKVKCGQCGGAGRLVCAACNGAGKITCQTCKGTGEVPFVYGESKLYST